MPIYRLATLRETRNPVRVQTWNATLRAGDDFKLALSLLLDDTGAPAVVLGSRSQMLLWPDNRGLAGLSWDYGLGWWTGATFGPGMPAQIVVGFTTPVRGGGINFAMPGAITTNLQYGRYRLAVQVDLPDGEFCQVEGVLQVRERWHRTDFLHVPALWADLIDFPRVLGQPVDPDGFFLLASDFTAFGSMYQTDQDGNLITDEFGNPIPLA